MKAKERSAISRATTLNLDFRKRLKNPWRQNLRIKRAKPAEEKKSVSQLANKASYKQQQEFKTINESIATLEKEKSAITATIAKGIEDHEELLKQSNRIAEIDSELEELEMVWLELSELEGIE